MAYDNISSTDKFIKWINITNSLVDDENNLSSNDYIKPTGTLQLNSLTSNGDVDCLEHIFTNKIIVNNSDESFEITSAPISEKEYVNHVTSHANPHKAVREWFVGDESYKAKNFLLLENTKDEDKPLSNKMAIEIENLKKLKTIDYETITDTVSNSGEDKDKVISGKGISKYLNDVFLFEMIDKLYPVGSIYISYETISPDVLFGVGKWELLPEGRVLIDSDNEKYIKTTTGGITSITLTEENLPIHKHEISTKISGAHTHGRGDMNITGTYSSGRLGRYTSTRTNGVMTISCGSSTGSPNSYYGKSPRYIFRASAGEDGESTWNQDSQESGVHNHTGSIKPVGNSEPFSVMQPYLSVNMWRRKE